MQFEVFLHEFTDFLYVENIFLIITVILYIVGNLQKKERLMVMQLAYLGVTPAKEKQFNKKGIFSVEDLVRFFPRTYNDCSNITGILPENDVSVLIVHINDVRLYNNGTPVIVATCTEKNSGKRVNISWFHQNYLYSRICYLRNSEVLVSGKVTYNMQYGNYSLSSPLVFTSDIKNGARIYPVYSKINGMSDDYLSGKIAEALKFDIQETCPDHVIKDNKLLSLQAAINELHAPTSMERLESAKDRLVFDDLLYFALRMEQSDRMVSKGSQYGVKTLKMTTQIIESLPYSLTEDQKNALWSMVSHMKQGKRINALVQGDVGCGKSIIAFLMMVVAADSGYQAVLMAPTQVLAKQHYEDFSNLVAPFGLKTALLGGNTMKKSEKEKILEEIRTGEIQFVIGTHAVLNKEIQYKALAIAITDEEHKFGVLQRATLVEKASTGVHSITMSATPIPRSLAMVIYGNNIQMHTIKTMPRGRMPVKTAVSNNLNGVFRFLLQQINQGRQIYVVCPMIEKNEDVVGVRSVEEISELYRNILEPKGISVSTLTGKTPKDESAEIISKFKCGEIKVLVSTTVIEVGVNVPNASAIVIHNAERFGLSGLHQLRGRVGRGKYQSYCVLFSDDKNNERLAAMVATNDGFKIAEEDLRLRGAGEFIGTKQSGDDKYMALMLAYPERYEEIKKIAEKMLDVGEDRLVLERMKAYTE